MLLLSVIRIAQVFLECVQQLLNECTSISICQSTLTALNSLLHLRMVHGSLQSLHLQTVTQPAKIRLTNMAQCGQQSLNECLPIFIYQSTLTTLNSLLCFRMVHAWLQSFNIQTEMQPAKIHLTSMVVVMLFIAVVGITISNNI